MGRQILAVALLAALATPVGAARADNTDKILADCADGVIDGSYSRSDLKTASNRIPSDIDEYSDCRGALAQARLDAGSGSGGPTSGGTGGSGSSGTPAGDPNLVTPANPTGVTQASADPQNPTETTAINEATRKGGSPVSFGAGARISPGSTGLAGDDRRSIPNPLLVALILLTTAALLGAVLAARARVITRRLS
jgi:hypothetical protein